MKLSVEKVKSEIERIVSRVNMDDIGKIVNDSEKLGSIFKNRYLVRFVDDLKIMISLLKDYWSGEYRQIPWGILASVAGALLYVLMPFDLIPDMLPVVGFIDDAFVMSLCLSMISNDLEEYKKWKNSETAVIKRIE